LPQTFSDLLNMRYFPIYLDLKDRPVLVVGGGEIAEGKLLQLVDAGAAVRVVSPTLTPTLMAMASDRRIERREGRFEPKDLDGIYLVISATDDQVVNQQVAQLAGERGLLCNVVDQPALCNFITPSLVTRGRLQISVSSGGASPSLTQRVKREIAALIGDEYDGLLELAAEMRREAKERIPDFDRRRSVLHAFVESEALALLRDGRVDDARRIARTLLEQEEQTTGVRK
jgi:siroheme synthase-like protein